MTSSMLHAVSPVNTGALRTNAIGGYGSCRSSIREGNGLDAEGFEATSEDVDERIRQDFAADQFSEVRRLLQRIEDSSTITPPAHRVQMAVLLLAEGDWHRLEHYVGVAEDDQRDVLYWAFYPDR